MHNKNSVSRSSLVLALVVYPSRNMEEDWHYAASMTDDVDLAPGKPEMVMLTRIIVPERRATNPNVCLDVVYSPDDDDADTELSVTWLSGFCSININEEAGLALPKKPYHWTSLTLKADQEERGVIANDHDFFVYSFEVKVCASRQEAQDWLDEKIAQAAQRGDKWMESYRSRSAK